VTLPPSHAASIARYVEGRLSETRKARHIDRLSQRKAS
jgi:hypothetical protein